MFTRAGLRIGRILGIPIYLDASWVFIFAVMTYSLVMRFTAEHPHWTVTQQWTSGISTSILFFASVLFHELSHSVVAQQYKIRVISITLFIFGGVARIRRESTSACQEFNIAIAGPLASFFLFGLFYGVALAFPSSEIIGAPASYLAWA